MSNIFNRMKAASAKKTLSATKLVEEYGEEFIICGFNYAKDKKGKPQAVFVTGEGVGFYATGWQKENLLSILEEFYGSPDKIDAALRANPQRWRMERTTTAKGNLWIRTEVLEELEGEIENESGRDNGAEREHGTIAG